MGNAIKEKVNIWSANEYTTFRNVEDNQIKLAKKNLNELANTNKNNVLPREMFQAALEAWSRNGAILNSIARKVNDYCVSSHINIIGDSMEDYFHEVKFVKSIKAYDDFCYAVLLKEDIATIWIVINEACFSQNKKYLRDARTFKNNNKCTFNITIFDKTQIEGINEELESYEKYEVISKNAE